MSAPAEPAGEFGIDVMHETDGGSRWGYRLRRTFATRADAEHALATDPDCRWMRDPGGALLPVTAAWVVTIPAAVQQ